MWAIYKKELKSYFTSMIGFVFMGFFLAVVGIYTVALNLISAYSNFEYVLSSISFVMIILIPLLTMRVIAEEKKQKTDQLLYTSPLSVEKIILGKYMAVLTLYLLTMAFTFLYPVILSQFGSVNYAAAYGSIIGFTLMGASYIALGVFLSSLTESQVIAAVVSFLVFLLSYLMPSIAGMLPSDKTICFVVLCVFVLLVSWLLYFLTHSYKASLILAVCGAGVLTALYFLKPELFSGLLAKLANSVSLISRTDNFMIGIFAFSEICYFLTVIAFFLFLSIVLIKHSFTPKSLRAGAYRAVMIASVMVITILINLVVTGLNIQLDLSLDNMYTLTDKTKELAEKTADDITVYYIVQDGSQNSQIESIVNQYNGLGNVKVVEKDPVLSPSFTSRYTQDDVQEESIIVVNETTGVSKYVPYADMLVTEVDYTTYNYSVTGIDVEGQITAAIQFVTAEDLPKMYTVTGHGESELPESVMTSIHKLNIETETIETMTIQSIPEDCGILLVNAPAWDLTDEETAMIKDYLESGGKAILNVGYSDSKQNNYDALVGYYGLETAEGLLFESDGNYMGNYPTYVVPQIQSHEITSEIEKYLVMAVCRGLRAAEDTRSTLTIERLLTATDNSYLKTGTNIETAEKEVKDETGPFILGAAVTEKKEETETKLAVFSTAYLLDETFVSTGQFGNQEVFLDTLTWLADMDNGLSIPTRSIAQTYLTVTTPQAVFWGTALVLVLPLLLLFTGLFIWLKRRKN